MSKTTITVNKELWKKLVNLKLEENEKTLDSMLEKLYDYYNYNQSLQVGEEGHG